MGNFLKRLTLVLVLVPFAGAQAVLSIRITNNVEGALPIAVVPFGWSGAAGGPPTRIGEIVAKDLARSGRFAPLPVADLPSRPVEASEINFRDWSMLGTGNLVVGKLSLLQNRRYSVQFRLFDVFSGNQLAGFQFEVARSDLRSTAHQISDLIYEKLTGERGAFNTRIAYIVENRSAAEDRRYVLSVADSDGENSFPVLQSRDPIMSPAWSPDGKRLAYVSFEGGRPRIYIQDLAAATRRGITSFPGINGAPAWSPDGTRLALTLSKDGDPEIYVLHLRSGVLRRVTRSVGIDTEPAWSPDGQTIAFTSDRGGRPQIYRVPVDGGRAQRLTFQGTYNARPVFTPDGKQLVFVHGNGPVYRIAVLDLTNNALRVLTNSNLDESPSVSPNGRMILYATAAARGGTLAAVSVDGRVRQQLAVEEGEVRDPAWSPFTAPN